jgi:single-strand DNA-binding protein
VTGVGAALGKGDAVIVVGQVYTSEYEDKEGVRRTSTEVRATSVGPDLSRCIVRIESRRHPDSATDDQQARGADGDDADSDATDTSADESEPLPLTA